MPAAIETTPPLPNLSPVNGKAVTAGFDGGSLSADAGLPALREVERRLDAAGRLAACVYDPRDPNRTLHSVADILRFRMMMIAAGYEDGIDANTLRADPVFAMALERTPGERDDEVLNLLEVRLGCRPAETLALAVRPVRHRAPAPHQDRRPRRRDEVPRRRPPA